MVEKQFQHEIKVFHSDSGGEFTKQEFIDHLLCNGIVHLFSCPSTPEQNSIAERKHRHVVELGLAMMLNASIPKCFWVEAFLTATFLINRLPSPSLAMTSPYFLLHKKQPTYDLLRTFGCQCFPYLRPYAKDKLEPRSLPCIFLGYSDKHNGYRCLHISIGRIYISRHVVFDEKFFG
jgi:transposase InsO family protein